MFRMQHVIWDCVTNKCIQKCSPVISLLFCLCACVFIMLHSNRLAFHMYIQTRHARFFFLFAALIRHGLLMCVVSLLAR